MQVITVAHPINMTGLHDHLAAHVEGFHRSSIGANGLQVSAGNCGRLHTTNGVTRVVFADDISVAVVLTAIDHYETSVG